MATLKDIAGQTGVSVNTVSLALRGSDRVHEETRKRIVATARALDYTPNHAARALVNKRGMTIGLLLTDMTSPVLTQVAKAAEIELKANGYMTLLAASNGDGDEESRALATFRSRQVDGVLIYPNHRKKLFDIRRLSRSGMPVVLLAAKEVEDLNVVSIDEERGSELAVRHLLDLGHRRIGLLDGDGLTGNSEKKDGYRAALAAAGIAIDPRFQVSPEGHSILHGYRAMARLMASGNRPTAVLASTDRIAMGGLRWCQEHGLSVPAELSIFGYDNVEYAAVASTPLSSVDYPAARVAKVAVSLILSMIEDVSGTDPPNHIVIDPKLVIRDSTGPVPAWA